MSLPPMPLYRFLKGAAALLVFVIFYFSPGNLALAKEETTPVYLQSLIDRARQENLAETRFWHLLVHYKKNVWGGYESQEDGPDFFNSPEGKTHPQAELSATLKSFFATPEDLQQHPQCLFPARYQWLKSELSFDSEKLPEQKCGRLEGWLKDLNPEKITLVFASSYMNNPASMFGHTFLRIDKKREGLAQPLLDYGVNYAATIDTQNALLYTVKGLFGLFRGTFSVFPYYQKVEQYSHWESRDLWEYELNLTNDQMRMLLLHLWELGDNYFDYLYFQENCSYHILSLLEVARPDLYLTDPFFFAVIPADTIKVITQQENMVRQRVYRPSLLSQMNDKRLQMNPRQEVFLQRLTKEATLSSSNDPILSVPEKAQVLDTYLDYLQYKNMRKAKNVSSFAQEARDILLERSRLGYQQNNEGKGVRFSTPPELGHDSARMAIGAGRDERAPFTEIAYRPAYHDLLARDIGYSTDSQILFFDAAARYYHDRAQWRLDRFKLLDIVSLTPYDPLFKKKSWMLNVGWDRIKDQDCGFCNAFQIGYGIGLAKPSFFPPLRFYTFMNVEAETARHLDKDYRAGGGGTFGMLWDISERWRLQIEGKAMNFPLGHISDYETLFIHQRYALNQNLDLRMHFAWLDKSEELHVSMNYYF